jgi:hypothetical protein
MPFGLGKKQEGQEEKPEAKFDAKYIGGHKMFPKATDTKVLIFGDRIEVEKLNHLKVPYKSMTNIENADESKISALRVVLLNVVGALWKKKHTYTVIQYKDALGEQQTMIFDFERQIDKVQPIIYQKMLDSRTGSTATG